MADKPKHKGAGKRKKGEAGSDAVQKPDKDAKPGKGAKPKKQRASKATDAGTSVAKAPRVRTRLTRGGAAAPLELELAPEVTSAPTAQEEPSPKEASSTTSEPVELLVSLKYTETTDGKKLLVQGAVSLNGVDLGQVSRLRIEASEGKRLPKLELHVGKGLKAKDLEQAPETRAAIEQSVVLLGKIPGIKVSSPLRRKK